jgi:hypothetical protein
VIADREAEMFKFVNSLNKNEKQFVRGLLKATTAGRTKKKVEPAPEILSDLLSTGQFGKLVHRPPKTVRMWIEEEVIPPVAVEIVHGRYLIRQWAADEVWD